MIQLECLLRMTRFVACFSACLLACGVAAAQTPAPGPSAVPAGSAAASAESPEITQFQKIEDAWSNAVNQHDQYSLELVLSPLFIDVAASGDITTRNQQLAQVITGEDKTLYLTQKVVTVRMLGDIAVANGTYTLHHRVNSVQVDEKGVFTHVFERLRGGWVCVNSQRTALREDSSAKSRKGSNIETPFHFPLFGKGEKNNQ
jgi:ketosteroid isomerase-like protein